MGSNPTVLQRSDRGPASSRIPQQVSDGVGSEPARPAALFCALSGLSVFILASASDLHTEARSGAGQAAEGGRNCLPPSRPVLSNPKHPWARVSGQRHPSARFSKPLFRRRSMAPHPVAVPPASQFCVSEAALAQTCSRPGWGCLSPSASICFMQGSGRKLCSLIDIQEDVVPAREIHPSQSDLQGNKFRVGQQCF